MSTSSEKFLPVSQPDLSGREGDYLLEAFRSGWISSIGSYINKFERAAADAFECEHAVCVSNGTVALHLALRALDITPGDEVVVPALTFVATAAVVIHAGATPVFVDCDPEIGTLCPEAFARAVGPRTKAVIPVHLYGHPVDMDPVLDIAKSAKIAVIEDAAEAHGARYKRRFVGSMGTVGAFSFYANKIVTTGEGGLLTTSDARLAERLRLLRDHAMDPNRKYWHTEPGFNYRMTNLQAAIGCAQFERLNELISKRQDIAEQYRSRLSHLHGMRVNPSKPWAQPVNWLTALFLEPGTTRETRDSLIRSLHARQIDSRPFFYAVPDLPPYMKYREVGSTASDRCVNSRLLSARGLNLPTYSDLNAADISRIANAVTALANVVPTKSS